MNTRDHALMKTVLIVNLEVKDNHEEAAIGARLTFDLCQEVQLSNSFDLILFYFIHYLLVSMEFYGISFHDRLNGLNHGKIQ